MKIKFMIGIVIMMLMQGHAYAFAGNCKKNEGRTGYVQAVYIGVDNGNDGSVTFNFLPDGSKKTVTISFYNYVSSKHNAVFPDDVVAAENTRVAFSLLLTAYSSGSPIKIMRCYGDGVVAFGTGQSGL